jgi:hypothetical protein
MRDLQYSRDRDQSVFSRRTLLGGMAGAAVIGAAWPLGNLASAAQRKGRIKQSACLWCYGKYMKKHKMDLDQFAEACAKMGLLSIELTTPDQWPTLKKHGLICAMTPGHSIGKWSCPRFQRPVPLSPQTRDRPIGHILSARQEDHSFTESKCPQSGMLY